MQALVAEYEAALNLINRKTTIVATLITFDVTAVATVIGFLLANKADPRLLALVPVISATFGLLVASQDRDIRTAEALLNSTMRPAAQRIANDDGIWNFYGRFLASRIPWYEVVTRGLPLVLLFPGASIASLAVVTTHLKSWLDWAIWSAGLLLTTALSVGWLENGSKLAHALLASVRRARSGGTVPVQPAPQKYPTTMTIDGRCFGC